MSGALALSQGVLYVVRPRGRTRVQAYDLGGVALAGGFVVRGLDGGAPQLRALSVDRDRRVWAADAGARAVRAFSAFGAELFLWQDEDAHDRAGRLGTPVGLASIGVESELRLLVANQGERRHALHWVDPQQRTALSLRPMGDPSGQFRRLAGVALHAGFAYACESGAARVQVFRDRDFHFAFGATPGRGGALRFEPSAIAVLEDGRMLVTQAGDASALLCFDRNGRRVSQLAGDGLEDGALFEPTAVAVDEGANDAQTTIAVLDRGGERVQLFTLDGRCKASFVDGSRASV